MHMALGSFVPAISTCLPRAAALSTMAASAATVEES